LADASNIRSESVQRLLEPSLTAGAAVSLYSARACFITSFFGGPIAALVMGWLNAKRLKRLEKDIWLIALLGALLVVVDVYFISSVAADMRQSSVLGVMLERRDVRRILQGLGLLFCLALYARHRSFHRAMGLAGVPPAKPWVPAIAVLIISTVVHVAVLGGLFVVLR
jgi:hypothetical protein